MTDLGAELLDLIARRIEAHPRSQQEALGPSEVGHPCARRLGYQLLGMPERPREPAWKATVGTAVHSWLEDMLYDDNMKCEQCQGWIPNECGCKPGRWLVEQTVVVGDIVGQPIDGHCDLYDITTGTVVDWKTCRCNPRSRCDKRSKPGEQYRSQAHLYGRGWAMRGYTVNTVAVMFLPRNGELRDAHYWSEPYDEQVAVDALQRVEGIAVATRQLGQAALNVLPTADAWCSSCDYFRAGSTDLTEGCPGDARSNVNKQPDPAEPAFGAVS